MGSLIRAIVAHSFALLAIAFNFLRRTPLLLCVASLARSLSLVRAGQSRHRQTHSPTRPSLLLSFRLRGRHPSDRRYRHVPLSDLRVHAWFSTARAHGGELVPDIVL